MSTPHQCRGCHPLDGTRCELPTGHDEMHQYSYSLAGGEMNSRHWERGKGVRGFRADWYGCAARNMTVTA